ncbi:hypothetical protein [Helicobacter cinaedi]|nr:hypothetical protein [Helicobacter cinaedi]
MRFTNKHIILESEMEGVDVKECEWKDCYHDRGIASCVVCIVGFGEFLSY